MNTIWRARKKCSGFMNAKRQVFRKMELKVGRSRPRNISRRINAQG